MVTRFFIEKIGEKFPYQFTDDQSNALNRIAAFLFSGEAGEIFLLY